VATVLDKELKRQITVDELDYTVAIDPDGIRLTGKGKRKPEVQLRWHDLVSGDAAMAVALNASLGKRQTGTPTEGDKPSVPSSKREPTKRAR
jgi:hypothetical protein